MSTPPRNVGALERARSANKLRGGLSGSGGSRTSSRSLIQADDRVALIGEDAACALTHGAGITDALQSK